MLPSIKASVDWKLAKFKEKVFNAMLKWINKKVFRNNSQRYWIGKFEIGNPTKTKGNKDFWEQETAHPQSFF